MPRRPPAAAWPLLGAVALLVAGCGLFDDDDGGAAASSTAPAASTTTTAPPRAPELLDPGAAPREALRLRLVEGATTTVALTVDLDVTQRSAGTSQRLDGPAVTETVAFTVGAVDGDEAAVSFEFTDAAVDRSGSGLTDAEYLTVTAEVAELVGLSGTGTVSDRGRLRDLAYDRPDGLDPTVAAALDQFPDQVDALTATLPDEPVGVGARWRTTDAVTASGITVDQVTTYEITARTADRVTYSATIEQAADEQDVELRGLPAGTTARLASASLRGTGTATLDLGSLVATGSSSVRGTQAIDLTQAKAAPLRLDQDLAVSLTVAVAD